jgi:hypothetical protein
MIEFNPVVHLKRCSHVNMELIEMFEKGRLLLKHCCNFSFFIYF